MKRYITTILCLLAFTAAYAGDEATYEKLHTSYTLAADGSQQYRRVMDLKLETHTSFNDLFGETFVVYDPEYQTLTINEAYTTQADGTVVPLPDNAVNESLPHAAADAPAYNRLREAVITHTGLEIGATIHLDYTLSRTEFERITHDLLERCKQPVTNALRDANLRLSDLTEVILVGGSTRMPAVQDLVKKMTGKQPNMSVNPDEVVACGAALSLGVETMGGIMTKMIDRNTTIPTSKTEIYSTAADNQTSVEINVLQGERELARDNKSLGKFQLTGIPAARRGVPQIEVTFDIDANGIVKVSAKDKGTGKEQQITISGSTALSDEEVDRMVKDAEAHAEEDKKQKEEVEVRNQTDSLCYSTEQTLSELGDKVPADVKSDAEAAISAAKSALEGSDVEAIKSAGDKLQDVAYKLAQIVYSDAQAQADGGAQATAGSDDDVVDAEYEVVDDEDAK